MKKAVCCGNCLSFRQGGIISGDGRPYKDSDSCNLDQNSIIPTNMCRKFVPKELKFLSPIYHDITTDKLILVIEGLVQTKFSYSKLDISRLGYDDFCALEDYILESLNKLA